MPKVVYESIPTLPPVAATIVTVCIFIMLAGLAIWIAGQALVVAYVKIVGVHLTLLAAKTKLAEVQKKTDADALNFWIRENFRQKDLLAAEIGATETERHRADQEAYNKRQLIKGRDYLEGRAI